jgi:WD40 repeat protein
MKQTKFYRQGDGDHITQVALSPDGKQLAAAFCQNLNSGEAWVTLWDTTSDKTVHVFRGQLRITCMSLRGKYLATGSIDNSVRLWDRASGKLCHSLHGHSGNVTSAQLTGDGQRLWTASRDGTARLWDTASGKNLCTLMCLFGTNDWLVVTPDGYYDGSATATNWLVWSRRSADNRQVVIDDAATRKGMYRPGLLAQVATGEISK